MILVDPSVWVDHPRRSDAALVALLAAVLLTPGANLWTRDKRLLAAARRLDCAYGAIA